MISLANIEKVYRTKTIETLALNNINLEVAKGEFLSIMGPSGCGKSTLLNMGSGLYLPTTGEVFVDGEPAGKVTAGAMSPYLGCGVGIALMDSPGFAEGDAVEVRCIDGELHPGTLAALPLYDKEAEIPRGKRVDIPERS